jgi:tetratricopeptide (TPR) repeat protein
MAHVALALCYANLGESNLAETHFRKAFELRERVSQLEKLNIESHYFHLVTGDLEKARQVYELWAQTYPRAPEPHGFVIGLYNHLGQYDKALAESLETRRLMPNNGVVYASLVYQYVLLNRLPEAKRVAEDALGKGFDSPALRTDLYLLAFLQNDFTGMAQQVEWSAGHTATAALLLASEADTAAYFGRFGTARQFSRQAVASAKSADEKEAAAVYAATAALHEALVGEATEALSQSKAALTLSADREVYYATALALARAGDNNRADLLANELDKRFPEGTLVQFSFVPTIRAQLALNRNDFSKAIEELEAAAPYELGTAGGLYPIYVRGESFLVAHRGSKAAAEFQKIVDHRGIVLNDVVGALSHLQLGRALVMQGDTVKARVAYQDFFALWRDADRDIPILKQAKAEYAKLQ